MRSRCPAAGSASPPPPSIGRPCMPASSAMRPTARRTRGAGSAPVSWPLSAAPDPVPSTGQRSLADSSPAPAAGTGCRGGARRPSNPDATTRCPRLSSPSWRGTPMVRRTPSTRSGYTKFGALRTSCAVRRSISPRTTSPGPRSWRSARPHTSRRAAGVRSARTMVEICQMGVLAALTGRPVQRRVIGSVAVALIANKRRAIVVRAHDGVSQRTASAFMACDRREYGHDQRF